MAKPDTRPDAPGLILRPSDTVWRRPLPATPPYQRILLTGAAGRLGCRLRLGLAPLARTIRLADREPLGPLADNEEESIFDLADMEATIAATKDCDAIVHFGGAPLETGWQTILDSSIRGSYHVYEGARKHGVRRVVYASSVHAIGFHELEAGIGVDAPVRPDGLYGVSKTFVESLSRLYWDKFGIETACLRIFSSFPEPADRRMLWSWLSFDDCVRLVTSALTAPRVGHSIAFGLSDNRLKPVDTSGAGHLGFVPRDDTEPFRAAVEARTPVPDPKAPAVRYLGGWFCELGHPDDAPGA
jgi:uronate dehydrogenase